MKALLLPVLVVLLLVAAWLLPIADVLQDLLAWIQANPTISWIAYVLLYIVSTVLMLPGSILTLGAGFVFGLTYGFALVSFASVCGATLAFLVGRFLARGWVESKLESIPKFAALDRAVKARGALIVLLTRLSPAFPFNLLNYALGLTAVRLGVYVGVSWIGMIPGTLLYVYLGSVASDLSSLLNGDFSTGDLGGWLFYVGLAATLVLTIVITRIATQTLNQQLEGGETP
ncbi:MAG: putative membrane protein YdjX (TVP38/TMEM64 family) [Limisphaerales bacterium]